MNYSYRTFFQKLYQKEGRQYAFAAGNAGQALLWQDEFREALKEKLGLGRLELLAGQRDGAKAEFLGEWAEDGYVRRKYRLETLPDVWMPFWVLIPETLTGMDSGKREVLEYSAPAERCAAKAMIAIPAHGANKNTVCGIAENPEEERKIREYPTECYGMEFVKRGYLVFCPDPPGYGERREPMPTEDQAFTGRQERSPLECSCKDLAQTAEAFDLSLTALEIWDLMRLVDFVCSYPGVAQDKRGPRIGCAGFSGGGQYAMWLAALDMRLSLAVVSGYVHGYPDSLLECHLCPCNYAPGLWKMGDISDICSLIAPRPLFVENGIGDVENGPCGISGPIRQVEKIREAYDLFGCSDRLEHFTPEGPHRWYGGCCSFVDTWL